MISVILARLQQKHRTMKYPASAPPAVSDRYRGLPVVGTDCCPDGCRACADVCPVGALRVDEGLAAETGAGPSLRLDLGKCLFCAECGTACHRGSITFTRDYRMAARRRDDLIVGSGRPAATLAAALETRLLRMFGRSLKLRQVSAGGCNACEADVNVLGTVGWDLGRFGIQMVASPRHADGLLVTGPVTKNMELALKKTYEAVPEPKIVIAVGACAIAGGPYAGHDEVVDGAASVIPVDLFVPGCPPHPLTMLDGLLRLLGRIDHRKVVRSDA